MRGKLKKIELQGKVTVVIVIHPGAWQVRSNVGSVRRKVAVHDGNLMLRIAADVEMAKGSQQERRQEGHGGEECDQPMHAVSIA